MTSFRVGFAALLLLCATSSAMAQDAGEIPAAQSRLPYVITMPGVSVADPAPHLGRDANPASINLVPSSQLLFLWGGQLQGGTFAGALGDALHLAYGVHHYSPEAGSEGWGANLDVGLSPTPEMTIGFSWQNLWGNRVFEDKDALSVGMLLRPGRWFSLGLVGRNLSEEQFSPRDPDTGGKQDLVQMSAGMAIRPGIEWLSIGADVTTDRKWNYWDPSAFLSIQPVPGIELGANGYFRNEDSGWNWGAGAMLSIYTVAGDHYGGYTRSSDGTQDWVYAARFSSVSEETVLRPGGYVVKYALPGGVREAPRGGLFSPPGKTFLETRLELSRIASDPQVDGVVLYIGRMSIGWSQAQELAGSVSLLRKKGKKVLAYLSSGGNKEYYLAAHADKIMVSPATMIYLTGIASSLTFLKDLMAWIGLEAQFARIGKYKTYPEQFINSEPSPGYKEAHLAMLGDFFGQLVDEVAVARGVDKKTVAEWIDAGPYTAGQAKVKELVDFVTPIEDLKAALQHAGMGNMTLAESYPIRKYRDDSWGDRPAIAVLVIEGSIVEGRSQTLPIVGMKLCGSSSIVAAARKLKKDPGVEGVLVRINSPGGSALGSELINRALRDLALVKPLVVSIGNVAASGGYYAAVASDRIFIMPGSVTGSIGIFFGKVVASELLDKLRIRRYRFDRGRNASILSLDRRLTDEEMKEVLTRISDLYDLFLSRVAKARGKKKEEVDALGQGRVWSGERAVGNGLADEEGGVLEALAYLKAQAGIAPDREVKLRYFPRPGFSQLIQQAITGSSAETGDEAENLLQLIEMITTTYTWAIDPWLADFN